MQIDTATLLSLTAENAQEIFEDFESKSLHKIIIQDLQKLTKIIRKSGEVLPLSVLQFGFARAGTGAKWGPFFEPGVLF